MAVYRVPAVGGVPRRLTRLPCVDGASVAVDWSPRGGRLLLTAYCPNSSSQAVTWTYSLATDKLVRRFGGVAWPRWMPDGRSVVFTSQCAGADGQGPCVEHQFNVYVADVNGRHRVAKTALPGCADDAPCMDGYSQVAPAPSGRDFAVTYTRASDGAGCIRALHGRWKHCVEWRYPNSPSWASAG